MQANNVRQAAAARRAAAEQAGERGGEEAYRQYRLAVTGHSPSRIVGMPTQLRAEPEKHDGKDMIHTWGFFTTYNRPYPMWDDFGEYEEMTTTGAGAITLSADPDVAFLVNHRGVTMARTRAGSLELDEKREGGWHDAWLNPKRVDVSDLATAINDKDITEMSFAFMIPDGLGMWNEDFTLFRISGYDIDRGDVSAVNYGANPYTDISARAPELLRELAYIPRGARAEALHLLTRSSTVIDLADRKDISWRAAPPAVAAKASAVTRGLQSRHAYTSQRLVAYAQERGLQADEMPMVALPWYEIRDAAERDDAGDPVTEVLIYDEIGGSFGVSAAKFAEDLMEIDTPTVKLRMNSPGGSVFEGLAIHASILHHPATFNGFVDGLAASAASVIMLACETVTMMPGSQQMIHNASMMGDGGPEDWEKGALHLHRQSDNIAGMYAARAGGDVDYWRGLMTAETWMFGQEAVDLGLADGVYERPDPSAADGRETRMTRSFPLYTARYRYTSREFAPDPRQQRLAVPLRRRSYIAERPEADDFLEQVNEGARQIAATGITGPLTEPIEAEPKQVRDDATSEGRPVGRSMALVEALLAADGISLKE